MNRIFTYWVDKPESNIPAYIQLCMQTWYENIPDLEVIIINHENMYEWIAPTFDKRAFNQLSLPMQSDVISFAVLQKHSGIYMDADTIVTGDIFKKFKELEHNKSKLYFFGDKDGLHIAVMASFMPYHPALSACVERENALLLELLVNGTLKINWDTFGNAVVDRMRQNEVLNSFVSIIDKSETGAILESCYLSSGNPYIDYLSLYFTDQLNFDELMSKIKFGLVMLHNSWTPDDFKAAGLVDALYSDLTVSKLLRFALGKKFLEGINSHATNSAKEDIRTFEYI